MVGPNPAQCRHPNPPAKLLGLSNYDPEVDMIEYEIQRARAKTTSQELKPKNWYIEDCDLKRR